MELGWMFIGKFYPLPRFFSWQVSRCCYPNGMFCEHMNTSHANSIPKAFDLGLNCDSSKWKMHGHDLFSHEETQTRCRIWWACCYADRYVWHNFNAISSMPTKWCTVMALYTWVYFSVVGNRFQYWISAFKGRPTMVKDGDYETPLPDVDPVGSLYLYKHLTTENIA